MKIEKKYANPKHYSDKRQDKILYIVIQALEHKPTPHYHIVDGKAIQVIPDDFMSDSVNGGQLNRNGYLHGICHKYNSISIGVTNNMSEDDIAMCFNLIMTLKQRYGIKNDNIVRQKDVTGEYNPCIWCDNDKWNKDIKDKLIELS